MTDPFAHHPGLRNKITPADQSYFRSFTKEKLEAELIQHGLATGWWTPDEDREAGRKAFLAGRPKGDLWIFAYGSLMWDPALKFTEVRRAFAPNHARHFILRDDLGGRGTPETPGLMAALDTGSGCQGLAFRIAETEVDRETELLWRREMLTEGYIPTMIPLDLGEMQVEALAFLADHDTDLIASDITRAQQIAYLQTGTGIFGTSLDYIRNVVARLRDMRIEDHDLEALFAEACGTERE